MDEEQAPRIGIALFVATLLALFAIVMAEAFGFVFFEDQPIPAEADRHAHIYSAVVACLNEPTVIKIADKPVADCAPRKK